MRQVQRWVFVVATIWIGSGTDLERAKADEQVNTYTSDNQRRSSVAAAADGDFVVVWWSYGSSDTDASYSSILGQRFASDGSRAGGEFQVNTHTTGYQGSPSVAANAAGDFVVAWSSYGLETGDYVSTIQGQRYASDGAAIGSQFQVSNNSRDDTARSPSIAMNTTGEFVVAWEAYIQYYLRPESKFGAVAMPQTDRRQEVGSWSLPTRHTVESSR